MHRVPALTKNERYQRQLFKTVSIPVLCYETTKFTVADAQAEIKSIGQLVFERPILPEKKISAGPRKEWTLGWFDCVGLLDVCITQPSS